MVMMHMGDPFYIAEGKRWFANERQGDLNG